jgi:hypothetical protein
MLEISYVSAEMRRLRYRSMLALALAIMAWPPSPRATAGLAEWEVYTPGGHVVSHSDVFKDRYGTCLRSDVQGDPGKATIFASRIERWRYHPGIVAGQDERGYFLFDERTERVERAASESDLLGLLRARGVADVESGWFTPDDGWQEAWFPFMVWRPCKVLLGEKGAVIAGASPQEIEALRTAAQAMHSEQSCRDALAPERLAMYRTTTWGHLCARQAERGTSSSEAPFLDAFCRELRAAHD